MRFSKILLINPYYYQYRSYDPFMPIGLAYISEALVNAGIEHEIIDMQLGHNLSTFQDKIRKFRPDLIGISMKTILYQKNYELIKCFKKISPNTKIVVGGPHMTMLKEQVLKECSAIDYGVVLYGEETILEICKGLPPEEIKGLFYRKSNEVIFTGFRAPRIDSYSYPRYDKLKLARYFFAPDVPVPIISSRGCPYQCTFCISREPFGNKYYPRSPQNVVDEIEHWSRKGHYVFDFLDDNFTFDVQRVYLICDEIKKRGLRGLKLGCPNGVRADKVDKRLLTSMREVGFELLAFGVESGSERILKVLKKQESLAQIDNAIRDACDLGYKVALFFLVGSPYETWDDLKSTFELALKYPVYQVRFANIIPVPGTELFDWVKKNNLFLDSPEHYLNYSRCTDRVILFITPELSKGMRKKALRYADSISRKIEKRYYRSKLYRYGIFAELAAIIATSNFVRERLMRLPFTKRALRIAKRILIPKR